VETALTLAAEAIGARHMHLRTMIADAWRSQQVIQRAKSVHFALISL
jgi:hypothetical protein